MIFVTCQYETKPGVMQELIAEIKEQNLLEAFRAQPGNVSFDYYTSIEGTDMLLLVDKWEDDDAFTAHLTCEPTKKFGELKAKYITNTIFDKYEV